MGRTKVERDVPGALGRERRQTTSSINQRVGTPHSTSVEPLFEVQKLESAMTHRPPEIAHLYAGMPDLSLARPDLAAEPADLDAGIAYSDAEIADPNFLVPHLDVEVADRKPEVADRKFPVPNLGIAIADPGLSVGDVKIAVRDSNFPSLAVPTGVLPLG